MGREKTEILNARWKRIEEELDREVERFVREINALGRRIQSSALELKEMAPACAQ
jgi:hypothetical protein